MLAVLMMITIVPLSSFAEDNGKNSNVEANGDVEYQANNAVGDIILNAANEEKNEETSNYIINSVTVQNKTATANVINYESCSLVVAVYDNNGKKMLTSANATLEKSDEPTESTVTLDFDIDVMPDYYYIKAFLLNSENAPLCNMYVNKEHTKEFEEFMAKTTDDFDSDKVINIDESKNNNFLVVTDDTKIVDKQDGVNTVTTDDYANGTYVINNADKQIKGLKPGDIFYYPYGSGENEYIVAKVKDINVDGDTVTIKSDGNTDPSEMFDFVKIDISSSETTFDAEGMDESVTHEDITPKTRAITAGDVSDKLSANDKYSVDKEFEITSNIKVKIAGEVEFGAKIELKVYIDKDENINRIELNVKYDAKISISISGVIKNEIPLGYLGIDAKVVTAKIGPKLIFKVTVSKIKVSFTLAEASFGIVYDADSGLSQTETPPKLTFDPQVSEEASASISIGISAEANALFLVKAVAEASAGIEVKAKQEFINDDSEKHSCGFCLEGTVNLKAEGKITGEVLKIIKKEFTGFSFSLKILNFYLSDTFGFGKGICPGRSFKIEVSVKDPNGTPVEKAKVYQESHEDDAKQTNSKGKASIYVENGERTIVVKTSTGKIYKKTITANTAKSITIKTDEIYEPDHSQDDEDKPNTSGILDSGDCGADGDNVNWTLYNDGELVISGNGEMKNYYSFEAPWYSNHKEIDKVTIKNGVTCIGNAAFEYCSLTSVTIPDSVTRIGDAAFAACPGLTSVTIPDGVTFIDNRAFHNCESLTNVIIGNGVTSINAEAFDLCEALTNVTIGNHVKYIGASAFQGTNIINIYIPDSVINVDSFAFSVCENLTNVTIGKSVASIGENVFYYDTSLANISVNINNQNYSSDEYGVLFNKNKTELIQYPIGNTRTEYSIPNTVNNIIDWSFSYCTSIKNITIPNSVTNIGYGAFISCGFSNVTIPANVMMIEDCVFGDAQNLKT